MIWLSILFLALAGVCKGFLDAISDCGTKSSEWRNKYDFKRKRNHWWYFGLYKPVYSEKFPFSTTLLVSFTDKWHRAQFFMLRFIYLAIAVLMAKTFFLVILLAFVIFPVVMGLPFQITYSIKRR
jgi:hypothetical protein